MRGSHGLERITRISLDLADLKSFRKEHKYITDFNGNIVKVQVQFRNSTYNVHIHITVQKQYKKTSVGPTI